MTLDWSDGASGVLSVGGVDLEYACRGAMNDPQAPVVVLLHEGLGCVSLWRDFPARLALATGLRVFAYSRAGYGKSGPAALPRPLDYMTREALDVLPHVLDAVGASRVVLLGHSDGASIAAIYAGSVQDHRVRGAILMAPHFFPEEVGLAEIARARRAFDTGDLEKRLARYHRDAAATFRGWNDAWLAPGFRDWDITDVIDFIRVPVLAIQGHEDAYGTMAQIDELENRLYAPFEALRLDECGHSPHLDQPEAVGAAVSEFVQRLARIELDGVALP